MSEPPLVELLGAPGRRDRVLDDCVRLIDSEVSGKSGLLALPLKAAYSLVKGLKPGFVRHAMDFLLDDFARALDPYYRQWIITPAQVREPLSSTLVKQKDAVADALLGVTDKRAERSSHQTLKSAYGKLRGAAKTHVIAALPGLARTIQPYLTPPTPAPAPAPSPGGNPPPTT